KAGIGAAANELLDCIAFGPLSRTSNLAEYFPFGATVAKTVAGVPSLSEFPVRFVITESDALHAMLLAAPAGVGIQVGIIKTTGNDEAAYVATGSLGGSENTFEDPNEFEFTVALSTDFTRLV
ncbi:MAG: hypothetical protein OXE50_16170, partial [Chloroflexi bacterium]|nr:hypothetical protein [Chloroflexota bacterium]